MLSKHLNQISKIDLDLDDSTEPIIKSSRRWAVPEILGQPIERGRSQQAVKGFIP
jgi:hypothetical protein